MSQVRFYYPSSYNPKSLCSSSDVTTVIGLLYNNIIRQDNMMTGVASLPGAIIASPSVPADSETDQNYMYDWVRDSAITMHEVIEVAKSDTYSGWCAKLTEVIKNYIHFTKVVQAHSEDVSLGYARWNLNGTPSVNWTVQNDGPALRMIAHIDAVESGLLPQDVKQQALENIKVDLNYLVNVYLDSCFNIWEEVYGEHFFTSKIIRRAFSDCRKYEIFTDFIDAAILDECISDLEDRMQLHIQGRDYFKSNITPGSDGEKGNDKNIDVLLALLYGEVGKNPEFSIDTSRSMATSAAVVTSFISEYPLNHDDIAMGLGPNLGRYPFDNYDGDTSDQYNIGHPWFISGNAMAAFFYKIASLAQSDESLISRVQLHFADIYLQDIESVADIVSLGDRHILTTQRHWDQCHMSEQYDRRTGYMKSVRDLTWSYATYLMAARLRAAL